MAKDVAEVLGTAIGKVAREAAKSVSASNGKTSHGNIADRVGDAVSDRMKNVSGSKGLAAGIGVATAVPLAAKGVGKIARSIGGNGPGPVKKAGEKFGEGAKDAAKSAIPGKGGKSEGVPGVGKGRRMPIQQDIDIGAPIDMVYKQWVKFEEWPKFMHRLDNVSQEDDKHVAFKTKIWGISKQFRAEIVEHQPGERIKWEVTDGVTHTGVVTFHELGPRLTRVELNFDVQPGSLIEKAARGMRHVKRAVRADLARFKAYVLMQEQESSRGRSASSSAGSRSSSSARKSSSSGGRSRSASGGRKQSSRSGTSASKGRSSGSRTRASSNGRSSSSRSANGRSSSSRTSASSNGRSRSAAKKRSGARS